MKKYYVIKETFKSEKELKDIIIELFLKEWSVKVNDARNI